MRRVLLIGSLIAFAALLLAGVAWWRHVDGGFDRDRVRVTVDGDVRLDVTWWTPDGVDAGDRAPAVLLGHGLGDDQSDVRALARTLARAGYVVGTWNSRGVGRSGGLVGVAAPDGEVADVSKLVDELADRPGVQLDDAGDPRVAAIGISHGGGVAMLAAAADDRIDVAVPIFAWYDLADALEPNGVLKLRWASELFSVGANSGRREDGPPHCGRLREDLCAAWSSSVAAGSFTPEARRLLRERSPSSVRSKLSVPTLVVHGQMDSLFDLDQAVRLADRVASNHAPVRIEWVRGGHDLPLDRRKREHVDEAILRWLEKHLRSRGDADAGPRFTVELGAGRGHAHTPDIPPETERLELDLTPVGASRADDRGMLRYTSPPAGLPTTTTTLPGLGDLTGVPAFTQPTGQSATFASEPVDRGVELIGVPRIRLTFSGSRREGIAFVRLVDLSTDGRRITPRGLVTAVRLRELPPLGDPGRELLVELPSIAWRLAPGHRMGVEVTSTDAGYVAPTQPATFAVGIDHGARLELPEVDEPERTADTFDAQDDWRTLVAGAGLLALLAIAAGLVAARHVRHRDRRVQEPSLRDVPLHARGLTKRFGDGRLAVDDVALRVERGDVVGLVGPNGAGKTTTIRMLLGLVHPSDGFAHVFGQRVRPGIPHLSRVGALVEGPGLVPHLTGRQHLEQYWRASGRELDDAGIHVALEAVGLANDADRVVRTWSHGMRQRLGIAQALLGRPDLVLLDEPANGLDPAQMTQLRQLVRNVAADGRAVLLSSHLLAELEQVCSHVVLMAEGRVLRAGPLAEVVGDHPDLEAAYLALVADPGEVDDAH